MKLGTFVCPIDDTRKEHIAIVVYDHAEVGMPGLSSIKWMSDGQLSLREDSELQEISALTFCKTWCSKQMGYDGVTEKDTHGKNS